MKYLELLVENKSTYNLSTIIVRDSERYVVEYTGNFTVIKELRTIEV